MCIYDFTDGLCCRFLLSLFAVVVVVTFDLSLRECSIEHGNRIDKIAIARKLKVNELNGRKQ